MRLQHFAYVIIGVIHFTLGLKAPHLSPEMSDALQLLQPTERLRFGVVCLRERYCTHAELLGFMWEEQPVDTAVLNRFWHTYSCTWTEKTFMCPVDGGWTAWGEWDDCVATCGDGTKKRQRICNWPAPKNGGSECHGQTTSVTSCTVIMACTKNEDDSSGDSVQERALKLMEPFNNADAELQDTCMAGRCSYQEVLEMVTPWNLADTYWTNLICYKHFEGCAVDGGWSEWNPWSSCSSQCGTGKAYRSRRCNNPQPRHGGHHCKGPKYEEGACFEDTCVGAVGIFLTPWSTWSACSTTCDNGVKTSSRRCHGGNACDVGNGQKASILTREIPCISGLCPELGGWSEWSEWTVCTGMCSRGRQVRERACNNPRPQGVGNDCVGEAAMMKECTQYAPFCEGLPKEEQIHEAWSKWSNCSSPCDGGMRIRHRTCPEQKHSCSGELYDVEICNEDIPCPADGGWTEWSQWSVCTVTCGDGETQRFRQCSNPRPEFSGRSCEGESDEKKSCIVAECPASTPTWESWSQWSQCTVTCDGGINTRMRVCLHGKGALGGLNRMPISASCDGEYTQINVCNFLPCSVNGNWASWGEWGGCSRTCGEGVVKRDRTCTDPAPAGGGEVCGGYGTKMLLCYTQPCPATDEIVRTFGGSSFMMYRRASKPTKYLLVYIQFKPTTPSGVLALRHEDGSEQTVSVGLTNGYVKMYAKAGEAESEVISSKQVFLNEWNRIEATISGGNTRLRLNDGIPTVSNFTAAQTGHLNWDQPMYIGGALPHLFPKPAPEYVGFQGAISALRVNYKMYTLHEAKAEWTGVGLPFVTFNVGLEPADIYSQVTVFTGQEYMTLPCSESTDGQLSINVILRPLAPDGLILYHEGLVPGSFVALVMLDGHVTLYLNLGGNTASARSIEVDLSHWVIVQFTLLGGNAKMRMNGGPAIQLAVAGKDFVSSNRVDIGGVPEPDIITVYLSLDSYTGYIGALYEVTINTDQYLLRDAALNIDDVYINSKTTTLSAHYREVRQLRHSSVALQCNYANIHTEQPTITWIVGDKMVEIDSNFNVFKNIFQPYVSSLHLHALDTDKEGLYACLVGYRGKAILTHAFGVSIYEPRPVGFNVEMGVGYIVMANIGLLLGFVVGIFALSCFKCCRRRFFIFDMMYESFLYYLGLDSWACLRDENMFDRHTLMMVDASFHKGFSAREEKIKFDQERAKKMKKTMQQKAIETKKIFVTNEFSQNQVPHDSEKNTDKDIRTNDTEIKSGGKDATLYKISKLYILAQIDEVPGTSGSKNPVQYESSEKGPSSKRQSNDNRGELDGENLTQRPSECLSDRELNLRRLSHEIVSGRPESSTSGSSLGRLGSAPPTDEDSPGPLILLEEEEEDDNQELKEEPIYVNIDIIRERQRLSSLRVSKGESSASFDTDHPPGLDSPNTRKRLLEEEPVEVDMDVVRENWRQITMSSENVSTRTSKKSINQASKTTVGLETSHHYVVRETPSIPTQDKRRMSVKQASHDAGHLFSHRSSIGGAVAKLSEAVADEEIGLEIQEGASTERRESLVYSDNRGADSVEKETTQSNQDAIHDSPSGRRSDGSLSSNSEDEVGVSDNGEGEDNSEQTSVDDEGSE